MMVLCDIDGVLADTTSHILEWLRSKSGFVMGLEEATSMPIEPLIPLELRRRLEQEMPADAQFCWSVPRYHGAQQFVKDLVAAGHAVKLVTHPLGGPHWEQSRSEWIESLLSFQRIGNREGEWNRIAGTALQHRVEWEWNYAEHRHNCAGDVLVEDRHDTATRWAKSGRDVILFDRPWNRCGDPTGVWRVRSYGEALARLAQLAAQ